MDVRRGFAPPEESLFNHYRAAGRQPRRTSGGEAVPNRLLGQSLTPTLRVCSTNASLHRVRRSGWLGVARRESAVARGGSEKSRSTRRDRTSGKDAGV